MEAVMKNIKVGKLTLNVGAGKDQAKLDKGVMLIKHITGIEPVKTVTNKRIPNWGLRPGLPIGCKITLRKDAASSLLRRLLEAKSNQLLKRQFDENGNVSFGVHEYIDIPGVKYEPKIGVMGFEACVTLERPGYRITKRRLRRTSIPTKHRIKRDEAIAFMQKEFNAKIGEEE